MSHLPSETDLTRRAFVGGLREGLIAYWALSEESGVRSDYHRVHELTDNNTVTGAAGPEVGSPASQFVRANSESLSVADHADFQLTGNFTFCASVYLDALPPGGSNMVVFGQYNSVSSQRSYMLYLYESAGVQNVRFITTTTGSGSYVIATWANTLATDTWHRFVCYYDGANIYLLHNNTQRASAVRTSAVHNSTAALMIGNSEGSSNYFDGRIARVGLWGRALSSQERLHLDVELAGAATA